MTIEELSKRCDNQLGLMSWCCGVTGRQMRRYIMGDYIPVERAALARERIRKIRNLKIPKEERALKHAKTKAASID